MLLRIIILLVLLGPVSPAHAQLESVKALVIGIDYLNDPKQENDEDDCRERNPLCLTRPRDDARQVFCALHPSVRQQSFVFIESEFLNQDEYSRSACKRPRYIDNQLREDERYPTQSSNSEELNLTEADRLSRRIDQFIEHLEQDDIAFVYLAGHAFEVSGEAYFVPPVEFASSSQRASLELISIQTDIINKISSKENPPAHLVLVIDACRQDFGGERDVEGSLRERIFELTAPSKDSVFSWGLTPLASGEEDNNEGDKTTLTVFFSTAPGEVASDRSGFARIFASHLSRRQPFTDVVRNTQAKFRDNGNGQTPYLQSNNPGEIYLRGEDLNPSP